MRILRTTSCLTLSLVLAAANSRGEDSELARRSLLLRVQYIATDYRGAVSANGSVASETEFAENLATARDAVTAYRRLRPKGSLVGQIDHLEKLVEARADPSAVEQAAAQVLPALRQELDLPPAPLYFPDLAAGAAVFRAQCASCHGGEGRGDGPSAAGLEPPPRSLADPEWADRQSPLQIFNTVSVGIAGTAMTGFDGRIDSSARWAIAFYVLTLRPRVAASAAARPWIGVTELSLKTNRELAASLKAPGAAPDAALALADAARRSEPAPLSIKDAMSRLASAATAAVDQLRAGRPGDASDILAAAYFDAVEPVEPALARAEPSHLPLLEMRVSELREAIATASVAEPALRALIAETEEILRTAGEADGLGSAQRPP